MFLTFCIFDLRNKIIRHPYYSRK